MMGMEFVLGFWTAIFWTGLVGSICYGFGHVAGKYYEIRRIEEENRKREKEKKEEDEPFGGGCG